MTKKAAKEKSPLHGAAIRNTFYFTSNTPDQYNAVNYFKPFADLHSLRKEVLHGYWRVALDILVESRVRSYQAHGQRLMSEWNTPSKGLGDFWRRLEENESERDQVQSTTSVLKKRAIRSVQTNALKAFNAIDRNLHFDDNDSESISKRQRQSAAMIDDEEQLQDIEDGDAAPVTGAGDSGGMAGMTQIQEGHGEVDKDPFSNADNFQEALSKTAATASTVMVRFLERSKAPLQPTVSVLKPTSAIYYLAGGGKSDCSRGRRSPYLVNGIDVSDTLWEYRSKILERAERMEPLESVERLVVSNMYLFEQEDSKSSLFHALGAKHWSTITQSTLQTKVTKEMLSEIGMKAVEISRMIHKDAQDHVDSTTGNKEIRRLLTSLFEDDFLWDRADFNEAELLQHLFNPFLKTFFGGMPNCKGRWEKEFEPSRDRRQLDDPNAKGRRPDYFLKLSLPGLTCHLFVLEAKKSRQTSPTQTDTEKVAYLLKDSIDHLARAAMDVRNIKLFGVVVGGEKASVYTMELPAKGVYVMKTYAVFHVPRSKDDLAVAGTAMDVLMNLKIELEVLISQCEGPRLPNPTDRTTTSYRTPQKVERTGIPTVRPSSPSIRAAAYQRARA